MASNFNTVVSQGIGEGGEMGSSQNTDNIEVHCLNMGTVSGPPKQLP